jgi:hypothetical protein
MYVLNEYGHIDIKVISLIGVEKTKKINMTLTEDRQLKTIILAGVLIVISSTVCAQVKTNKTIKMANQEKELKIKNMKKVLIIGMDPRTIDFSNPEIPQGLTVEKIEKGTQATLEKLNSMGYDAETFLIETGSTDLSNLARQLRDKEYDGIVVGNGIRGLASNFILFEQIINVIHENAPKSKIIFNTLPTNTDEAVKRWL